MICWSCQREAGTGPLCAACGAIQPSRPQASHFEVLGLPASFFLEPSQIEQRFKELNKKLHPDRFAQKDPRERRMSLEWTTQVNDARRTLEDPLDRATYLAKLSGLDVEKESGPSAMRRLPPDFLEQVMEDREELEQAKAEKILSRVRALARDIDERSSEAFGSLEEAFKAFEAGDRAALDRVGAALAMLKYFSRFQEEVEAIEMAFLE